MISPKSGLSRSYSALSILLLSVALSGPVAIHPVQQAALAGNPIVSVAADQTQSRREASFHDLTKLDCRNAILKMVPLLIADARKPLKEKANAARLADDLQYISKALLLDENEIAAAQVQEIAVGLSADNVSYKALLADYLSRAGRPEEARKIFATAAVAADADATMLLMLAMYKLRCSDPNGARVLLDKFANREDIKSNAWFQSLRARTWLKAGFSREASVLLKNAAAKENNEYCKQLWLASAESLVDKPDEARKRLDAAGRVLPDDPLWHCDIASLTSNKNVTESQQQLAQALAAVRVCSRAFLINSYYLQGHGLFARARTDLDYIGKLRPCSAEVNFAKARLAHASGDLPGCVTFFQEGLKRNPYSAQAILDLANVYLELKQPEKYEQLLGKATTECPSYIHGWLILGDYLRKKNLPDDAIAAYDRGLSVEPDHVDDLNIVFKNELAGFHAGLACIAYSQNQRTLAVREAALYNKYKLILKLPPEFNMIHIRPGRLTEKVELKKELQVQESVLLADALLETKNFAGATAEYRKAISLNGEDPDLHSYLLNVLTESGDWTAAAGEDFRLSNSLVRKMPKAVDDFLHPKSK